LAQILQCTVLQVCECVRCAAPLSVQFKQGFCMMRFLQTLIQVSRPGFFHLTAIPFALPTFRDPSVLLSSQGIMGLLFVLLPLNLLVYSFNDYKDIDIDRVNPRKGGVHGAQASESDLRVCMIMSVLALLVLMPLLTSDLVWSLKWNLGCILVNWVYNFGPQLSRVPILDMFPPLGYLSTCLLAPKVLGIPNLDSWVYYYLGVVVFRTQLWLQRMDVNEDRSVGKFTTAVFVGSTPAAVGVILFLTTELAMSHSRGCTPSMVFAVYSMLVHGVELAICQKHVTMLLMGVASIPFSYYFMTSDSCLV